MSDTKGKSLFQEVQINDLVGKLGLIETDLNTKLDKFVYEAKKTLLENNDLRHNSEIAHLEANTVDKTVYIAKMALLDAKDFEQDNRIKTLQGLLPSKVDQSVFDSTVATLTALDANHEGRIVILENRANAFDTQISSVINVAIGQKIDEAVATNILAGLQDNSTELYQDLQLAVTKAAHDAVNITQDAAIALKADKTYVDGKVVPLEAANLGWEKRLNAVDQYIRLMLQTYNINLPGNPNTPWEYTAAFDAILAMDKYHFKVVARKPNGAFIVEMEPFAFNTFYGKLEMTLASGNKVSIKKSDFGASPVAPYRALMNPNITRELTPLDFPVTFKLYDSSGTEEGIIKSIPISSVNYEALSKMDAPRFSYSSSSYTLVKAYDNYTDDTCNNLTFTPESGSIPATGWSIVGNLPLGMSFASGVFSGGPNTAATLGDYSVVVKAANASGENGFQITFKVIAPPAISYTVTAHNLLKNNLMNDIIPATLSGLTTHGSLVVSTSGLVAGMFIDATNGRIYGAPTAVASNMSVTVTVTGLHGSSASTPLNFTVEENSPVIEYDSAGSVGSPIIYRLNTVIEPLNVNLGVTSGSITSLAISPALPAGLTFTAQNNDGAWIGRISGTPTESIAETKFTVTAIGPGGQDTYDIYISVLAAIPVISYADTSYVFTRDVAITNVVPTASGSPTEYALYNLAGTAPATLPGLTFATATGIISGTPDVEMVSTGYSIRATGAGGSSAPVTFYITVKKPVPVIAYAPGQKSFVRNSTIASFEPSSATNSPTLYTISEALPVGLNFNNDTGVVSGKPLLPSVSKTYFVVAYNEGGMSASASFDLDVFEADPVIAYAESSATQTFTRGVAIESFGPSSVQNHVSSYSAVDLPAGLEIDNNGVISGNPTVRTSGVVAVAVVASGNGGTSAAVTINIEVNEPAPVFSYGSATYVHTLLVGAAATISLASKQNEVTTWSAVGLPNGLSVNSTGQIVGTPAVVGGPITATVTAEGPDFSTTKNVVIDINQEIPATNVQNGALEDGSGYELKLYSNPASNTDEVFIKKLTVGDLTADLVYFSVDSEGVVTKESIASREFVGGEYIRFELDRAVHYGTENRLAVIDEFRAAGEVQLAKFVVQPAALIV
jgi:hypothetical protein